MAARRVPRLAAAILAVALSACSTHQATFGPFGGPYSPGEECIAMGRHTVATYGFDDVRNRAKTTAIIDMVSLRRPMGLQLLRAWAVRTRQVYGVGVGYPPPKWRVIGFHWDRRQPADGARVPHSTGKYDRMNLLLVVRLAPGRTRGRAAGVDVRYQVSGKLYYLPLETALVLKAGPSC